MSKGDLFIVSAPSGAGKTTVVLAALEQLQGIERTVSHTTRAPRGSEQNGVDYHFTSVDAFQVGLADDQFAEHAEVFGRYYGTSRKEVDERLDAGVDAVAVIDWQGARSMRALYPEAVTVFIVPPSMDELHRRLVGRGEDSEEAIARRLGEARAEASHFDEFDYVLVNDSVDDAVSRFVGLVATVRMRCTRQRGMGLLAEL